jgi:hypothetical protein
MPASKHDLAQLCGLGFNIRPRFIYFEPMFLGLWLRVISEWEGGHLALCFYKIFGLSSHGTLGLLLTMLGLGCLSAFLLRTIGLGPKTDLEPKTIDLGHKTISLRLKTYVLRVGTIGLGPTQC